MIQEWSKELEDLHGRIAHRFARPEPRRRALSYLKGLTGALERKNGWQLAEQAGEATPDGFQRLLNAADWDAGLVRDDLRDYALEHFGAEDAVLIVDETGFLKKGNKSVGVQRQYSGTAGRTENCQIGVFLCYASKKGAAFIDRALYLPKQWAKDAERRAEAGVPEEVGFATKPELARRMLERALDASVPAGWVTGDTIYGSDRRLRMFLEGRGQPFVLAVRSAEPLWTETELGPGQVRADRIAERATPKETTTLEKVVRVAGTRWQIESCFESAKDQFGLAEYEVRKWDAWHRHATLALLAHAFVSVVRSKEALKRGPKKRSCP